MVQVRIMSPSEYKSNHADFKTIYAFHSSPFGDCLLGITNTDKAVLYLGFVDKSRENALSTLKSEWPLSDFIEDTKNESEEIIQKIFAEDISTDDSVSVILKGTEFQVEVWKSLMDIPKGKTVTYEEVATNLNNPKAARAVGNAVMKNKIAYVIPCHRVKGKTGSNKYRWGIKCKENILMYESKSL